MFTTYPKCMQLCGEFLHVRVEHLGDVGHIYCALAKSISNRARKHAKTVK
jgi:hypothetical protein